MFHLCNCCSSSSSSSSKSNCLIFSDDFTRDAPKTPLGIRLADPFAGKGWCDNPGDYSTGTPQWRAKCITANAKAILNVPHPDRVGSMYVQYKTIDEIPRVYSPSSPGQIYRILLNVLSSPSGNPPVCSPLSYYFAEYERLGGSVNQVDFSWIRLGISSGGSSSILKEQQLLAPEPGLSRKFWAAVDENSFCAAVTNSFGSFISTFSPGLFSSADREYYSAFQLSEKDMLIDDYDFYKHYNSKPPETREQNCPSCGFCLCDDNTPGGTDDPIELPAELFVCIWPDPENCPRLSLLEPCCFKIIYDRIDGVWTHQGNVCCGGFKIRFGCSARTGAQRFFVQNIGGCPQSGGDTPSRFPSSYRCSSETGDACFVFGPYLISGGDLACACRPVVDLTHGPCSYYITVSTSGCCSRGVCNGV